jgi:hypothetical protein
MSSSLPYSVVVNNKPTIGGTLAGGTAGSVLFINPNNVIAQDNANFFYDDTNNRLGIGTTTPTAKLEVVGGMTVSGLATISNNLVANQNVELNGRLQLFPPCAFECGVGPIAGVAGTGLASRGSGISPEWVVGSKIFPAVIFHGTLAAPQVLVNNVRTQIGNITNDVINAGGTNLNTTTGRFTCPTTGIYNIYASVDIFTSGYDGTEATLYINIFTSASVLIREFLGHFFVPVFPNAGAINKELSFNFNLNATDYVVFGAIAYDTTAPASTAEVYSTFFGGSRIN